MSDNVVWNETLVEKNVTYTIEINGQFVLIENVPARVNVDTGEKYFSPETVERLHQAVWVNVVLFALSQHLCTNTPN